VSERRFAVVGGGIAGLTAAHVLQKQGEVTLFEAADRLGGHADTHDIATSDGRVLGIDTGFIVHNRRTYPTLLRLFDDLDVATQESDMSMSISCAGCGLEYAGGRGLSGLLPSARAVTSWRYLRMLAEVKKFHRAAEAVLAGSDDTLTLQEFLDRGEFSDYFAAHFMTPLVAAVWSTAPSAAGDYPARYLFTFLQNHGMLTVTGAPTWYTVVGGSARYVEKVAKGLTSVQTSTAVRSVRRADSQVELLDGDDALHRFDGVVIATHPHQALSMLTVPTHSEREVLSAIGYTDNPALLHTDTSVLPSAARAQASWNYAMPSCDARPTAVQLSYNMNRLQRLDAQATYVVTLNGDATVARHSILARMAYEHPVYTTDSVAARQRLPELNDGVIAFAGGYHGWGFHEDGAKSGVDAAASFGVQW
jgi:predicted NAD/FAD-binding protein